ncbi:MAG: hypothetical protein V3T20_00470 [Gemmatimonadota bacterium]
MRAPWQHSGDLPNVPRMRQEGVRVNYRLGRLSAAVVVVVLVSVWLSGCATVSSPSNAQKGEVYGYIRDAMTGIAIETAGVRVAGMETSSDSLGYYIVDMVNAGTASVVAFQTGYVTLTTTVEVPEGGSVRRDCALIPSTTGDEYRFVLAWGADPQDLDSHLWVPIGGGNYYHVYFSDKGSVNEVPYAELDNDEITGYGPETMTIYPEYSGLYTYAVYEYSGEGTLRTSGATLRIYQGDDLLYSLTVPNQPCEDQWWWNVCTFDAQSAQFTIINTLQDSAPVPTLRMEK